MQDADVYIFDSPFTGLDINSRKTLRKLINAKASSSTIIIIADVEDAPSCITHVAELENGRLKSFEAKSKTSLRGTKQSSSKIKHSTNNIQQSIFNGEIPLQQKY